MHDDSRRIIDRADRVVRERIRPAIHRAAAPLRVESWEVPGEPVPFAHAIAQSFAPTAPGQPWGRPWGTTWFRLTGVVPGGWRLGDDSVELAVDLGFTGAGPGFQAEGLVYRPDGTIIKGIEPWNRHVPLPAGPGAAIEVYVEAAANPEIGGGAVSFAPTALGDPTTAGNDRLYSLSGADVRLLDREVWALDRDLWTLMGLADQLAGDDARRADILRAVDRALDALDPWAVSRTAGEARDRLAVALARPAAPSAHRVAAIGHAHIDSAWLWPIRETIRKCARTFSNVLQLMDERPDFRFACSSAQQYAWMKQHYPELFARIADRVREGRFIPVGGMWVESDTNLPGGEALVRQFLAGTSFFLREFGVEPPEVWLPDSFGYTAALPQIAVAAGKRYLLTQKLSWNDTNAMPHSSFHWEGIDGTRIFTHFPPVATYNAELSGAELARAARDYRERGAGSTSLVPFGHGDGGGGPTRDMMAAADRTADLEGSPRVEIVAPADFFAAAEREIATPAVWRGELYLEFHRGTYTSQARMKRGNRRTEHLLREAELWATAAALRAGARYPYDELQSCWERLLLLQFHDILPGSSIAWVHREAEHEFESLAMDLEAIIAAALRALAGDGGTPLLANAGPFAAQGVAAGAVAPAGSPAGRSTARAVPDGAELRSPFASALFDRRGRLLSFVDAGTGREFVPAGRVGNDLQLFRDTPTRWDAWDVDERDLRARTAADEGATISVEPGDGDGPEVLVVARTIGTSPVRQRIRLAGDRPALEIDTVVDWREEQKLLKLAFPVDVHTDQAASEIQFGHLVRPTHRNTSWDAARYETPAHRWVRVAEDGAGLAIANDRCYGHDVERVALPGGGTASVVRQSLVRAPRFPDPDADRGTHEFRTTLCVAPGVLDAVREGYRVNLPPRRILGARPVPQVVRVTDPAIVVEAVKLAEDRSGDVVVRVYEAAGGRAAGAVTVAGAASVVATDVLERPVQAPWLRDESGSAELALRPFQLATLRFRVGTEMA